MNVTIQKLFIKSLILCTTVASTIATAAHHTDYAKVTYVEPIYESVSYSEPHRKCHFEERAVHRRHQSSATPKILGALVGGAIGNELGHNKSNKRVGAVAGAILGGSIASDLQRNNHRHRHNGYTKTEKVCHTSHKVRHRQELTGYEVNYKYRGRSYNTIMDEHPGDRLRVTVDVRPIDY